MQNILMVLTSHDDLGGVRKTGFYVPEAAHPYWIFKRAGSTVEFVSPRGGRPPLDGFDANDPEQVAFMTDPDVQARLAATLTPDRARAEDYDAVFYVGGHGTMWDFPGDATLARLAADVYERGGAVAAVCHGPAGLVNIRLSDGTFLVEGQAVAAFTNAEEEAVGLTDVVPFLLQSALEERGARHVAAPNFWPNVQVSGRLVTGQNPASARPLAEALLRVLRDHAVAAD